jgi:hypothetical protein
MPHEFWLGIFGYIKLLSGCLGIFLCSLLYELLRCFGHFGSYDSTSTYSILFKPPLMMNSNLIDACWVFGAEGEHFMFSFDLHIDDSSFLIDGSSDVL